MFTIRGTHLSDGTVRVTVSQWLKDERYPVVIDERTYESQASPRDRLAGALEVARAAVRLLETLELERASEIGF